MVIHASLANILLDYFLKGGPMMWPILVAFLAALTVITERVIWWTGLRGRMRPQALAQTFDAVAAGDFQRALDISRETPDPFLRTVHAGIVHAHSSLLGAMQICGFG